MIKMERTCGCMHADVLHDGEKIGTMDGVYLTQWFVKNKYRFTGTFTRYFTDQLKYRKPGTKVDIVFPDKKIIIKEVCIEWVREPIGSGTFNASRIESCI
ncbi:hypothetical protein [Methanobacterium alcaliphilum]|uniref:hypothetical protein n=1 Tax=Methanobacterium alcaliphilum TaxID=392018 RepID=UPI00200B028A|nr:hypothetical protein [Methanobacterium alcaliphilum]MCK9151415.1 hypothetical protein [Methanobacterium alcaliphilum]